MITEDYVSFGTAKLMKEKEFNADVNCTHVYVYGRVVSKDYFRDINELEEYIQAPTLQMAMKWLREVHRIGIIIEISDPSVKDRKYYCIIWDGNNNSHIIDLFNSYEESIEAALKYCLEILI